MKLIKLCTLVLMSILLWSCADPKSQEQEQTPKKYGNPAAEGFNASGSDDEAIEVANRVMIAMGGRQAWDNTNVFKWNFFGFRKLLWDKSTGWVRIENQRDDMKIIVNINSGDGRVFKDGEEFTNQDSLDYYLDRGKKIWINDAYWLFMPFKLKDSGVTLSYLGEDTTQTGAPAEVLRLTFENVGATPQNAYKVWVEKSDDLVKQWAYYREADQEEPNFITPWADYAVFGDLKLASDRGERDITEIAVMEAAPAGAFDNLGEALL